MEMPVVSVVIPAYNSAPYLKETIASVQEQSFQNFEIIIVDDCSQDNTSGVVQKFKSPNLHYHRLRKNHGGPSLPRNVGISMARGQYIALLDADDLYCPGRLSAAVSFLEHHPDAGLVFTDEICFDDSTGRDLKRFLHGYDVFWALPREQSEIKINMGRDNWIIPSKAAYGALFFENYIMPSGVTLPRKVFDIVGKFDEHLTNGDDCDLWFRIAQRFPIGFIHMDGFRYRVRENSISGRGPVLAENRSRVIHRQLKKDLPRPLRQQGRRLISKNNYGIGYDFQQQGNMKMARKYYLMSLGTYWNWHALKGLLISLMGEKLYFSLKKMRVFQ